MWNLPGCFRLPAKACRPQPRLGLLDRLFTVQGSVTNHKQGRVNLLLLPKNAPADSSSTIAQTGIFSSKNFGNCPVTWTIADGKAGGGSFVRTRTISAPCDDFLAPCHEIIKNPALVVCHRVCELLQHAGRLDCFRRPVKVSATIAACVPDRLIPVQGQGCQSRTGQGKSGCHFQRTLPFSHHDSCQVAGKKEDKTSNSPCPVDRV